MTTDYVDYHRHLEKDLTQLGRELPGPMTGFARLHKKAVQEGALSAKVKELMALAIGITLRCDGCIAYHVHDAIAAGATRQELLETIGVADESVLRFALRVIDHANLSDENRALWDMFLASYVTEHGDLEAA